MKRVWTDVLGVMLAALKGFPLTILILAGWPVEPLTHLLGLLKCSNGWEGTCLGLADMLSGIYK